MPSKVGRPITKYKKLVCKDSSKPICISSLLKSNDELPVALSDEKSLAKLQVLFNKPTLGKIHQSELQDLSFKIIFIKHHSKHCKDFLLYKNDLKTLKNKLSKLPISVKSTADITAKSYSSIRNLFRNVETIYFLKNFEINEIREKHGIYSKEVRNIVNFIFDLFKSPEMAAVFFTEKCCFSVKPKAVDEFIVFALFDYFLEQNKIKLTGKMRTNTGSAFRSALSNRNRSFIYRELNNYFGN